MKYIALVTLVSLFPVAAQETPRALTTGEFRWSATNPLLAPLDRDGDQYYSVKDPTVVQHGGRWHVFCTIRGKARSHQIEYFSFQNWDETEHPERHILKLSSGYFCAPQVFYFSPHKKWYLVYQAIDPSRKPALQPAYSTTSDISDPASWTAPKLLYSTHPENVKAWIDFWVICDDTKAHLFFTSLDGKMWRSETDLGNFPGGWNLPEIVLTGDVYEASHTYRLKGLQKYLTLIEARGSGGRRYYKAYVAGRLDGDWEALATTETKPFASPVNVNFEGPRWTDSFSHGELLREGHDQTLTVDPSNLRFLFQGATDAQRKGIAYGQIPWRLGLLTPAAASTVTWVSAANPASAVRSGDWRVARFRYAESDHLQTVQDGAALEFRFRGTGLILRQGGHAVPAYGTPNLGKLIVTIDGGPPRIILPRDTPEEVVAARGLADQEHVARVEHRADGGHAGCRIERFGVLRGPSGDLRFAVTGEANAYLVDVRSIVRRDGKTVRDALVRNWMTGQCRLAGLPAGRGYSLEIRAAGWKTRHVDDIEITTNTETVVPNIYLLREDATTIRRFRFPALNQTAVRKPGDTFRARFLGPDTTIEEIRLERSAGPAVISRKVLFEEDSAAAYYYDREVVVRLPGDMPEGLYDLSVRLSGSAQWGGVCRSPRSVHVVREFPRDPVLMTFGHLDTSGQYQSEYLERLAGIGNLLGVDMVLMSTACNPAYISGALSALRMPYVINFGNHQFYGHQQWYGEPVGLVDFGPDIAILNFGLPWHVDVSQADALLASRPKARMKIINAFEANAPVETILDKHRVSLIHDGHGIGKRVMDMGATPTRRVGKINSTSFRVVRFRDGRVVSCTYQNDEVAPIPFGREEAPPVRVAFEPANDGSRPRVRAVVTNTLKDAFPNGRIEFVLPAGAYVADKGRVESAIASDDGRHVVLTVRSDIPAAGSVAVAVRPQQ